jgi:hypothetical protein
MSRQSMCDDLDEMMGMIAKQFKKGEWALEAFNKTDDIVCHTALRIAGNNYTLYVSTKTQTCFLQPFNNEKMWYRLDSNYMNGKRLIVNNENKVKELLG